MGTGGVTLPKKYRPAWKGMGWWRWLGIILIVYSLLQIVPYILFAGGSHAVTGTSVELRLAGCRIQLGADRGENSVYVTAKIDPACSVTLEAPTVELLDGTGAVITSRTLRGNPNSLSTRLQFKDSNPGPVSLALRTRDLSGRPLRQSWQLSNPKQ